MPASLMTSLNGFLVRSSRSEVRFSNWARVSDSSRLAGPFSVSDRYGRAIVVEVEECYLHCAKALSGRSRPESLRSGGRGSPG